MVKNPVQVFETYREKLGPTFGFHFGGIKKTIVTADPEMLQYILKDNNSNYHKSHIQVERFVEFQGVGLTNSHGDYWLRQRRLLSMGFTRSRLTEILPLQMQVLNDFMLDFESSAQKGPVEIHDQMVRYTLRAVGNSLFGRQMKEEELDQFANAIADIQKFIVKKVVQPYLSPWYRISGQDKMFQNKRLEAEEIIRNYIARRRKSLDKDSDILKLILTTPYKDTGELMSDEKVMVEIMQLLVAGNETSTTAATWAFYLLAKHKEHIPLIRKEIDEVFGSEEVSYSHIHELKYTTAVLNEAMRLRPPFWMIDREAQNDDEYNGVKIPKGTTVVPYIYGVHHNKAVWKDAEVFRPERFLTNESIHPFAHIPFGGGPRVCIGQNMAKMQILLVMSAIVRKYDFELMDEEEVGVKAMMLLKADRPIHLNFTQR
jgi:cytochrome P450